jgi:iron complex outermembrane recepter protein
MTTILLALALAASLQPELHGLVVDASSGSPLPGATVYVPALARGAAAGPDGTFALDAVPPGSYAVEVRHVGYRPERLAVVIPLAEPLLVRLLAEPLRPGEVVVTASPTGGAATQAAQVFRMEELQRRAAPSFGEMLDGAAGVAMRSFGSAPARPVIRGLDGDRVLVLENGERMGDLAETAADHAIALDPLAVHRIEVVRGPASLLYGPSAVGGVVNLFNEDVPQAWAPGVSGQAALQGATVNGLGAGHGRLAYGADSWAVAGRLAVRGAGDTATPEGPLEGTFLRSGSGGLGATWRPGGPDGAFLGASLGAQAYAYGLPELDLDEGERVEIRMRRATASGLARVPLEGRFEGLEVRVLAADYGHDEVEVEGGEEEVALSFHQRSASATATLRHRAIGPFAAGALGLNLTGRDVAVGGAEALTPDASSVGAAAFAFEEVALSRAVRLQGGLRLDAQALRASGNAQYPGFQANRTTATLSGALGLSLRPSDGIEAGLQLARAYRLPRLEELYADAPHLGAGVYEVGDPELGNEVALGLDAFVRGAFGPVTLEAAAFSNRIDGFVVFQPMGAVDGPSGLPIHRYEAADALLLGGEVSASARLTRSIAAEAGADLVRGSRRDAAATPLPAIPPLRTRLVLAWDDGRLRLGGSARLVTAQERVAPNEEPTPGYTLLGLEGAYRLQRGARHVVALRVDNLLNVAYRDHLSRVEQRQAVMPGRNVVLAYQMLF